MFVLKKIWMPKMYYVTAGGWCLLLISKSHFFEFLLLLMFL